MNMRDVSILTQLKTNWKSALSVALVSVPLSLSLGIASGAGPVMGIITAIIAGLVAGMFGGSRFNIVGPAGALSGILAGYALIYGPSILPIIALVSGVLILIIWALKWDKYLIFVPSSVVHGFTLGVALTIGFGQLNFALGISGLPTHEHLIQNIFETLSHIGLTQWASLMTFAVGVAVMFGLLKWKPRLPNTVILAILGIGFGYAASTGMLGDFTIPTLFTKYGDLSLTNFSLLSISKGMFVPAILSMSAVVAFVVVLETLISAKVADGMTKTKFNQRREVLGVGFANIASGVFGGMPASGVFARTSINVRSGATSNWSQILNALFVAIISIVFLSYFKYIPLAVIGAILVYAAVRMVTLEHFKKLLHHDRAALYNALAIAAITVVYDATAGIVVGMLVALFIFARRFSVATSNITVHCNGTQCDINDIDGETIKEGVVIYRFGGELTYVNAKAHTDRLHEISSNKAIVLNMKNLFSIDADGIEALDEIIEDFIARKQTFYIAGARPHIHEFLKQHQWFCDIHDTNKIAPTTFDALRAIENK